MSLARAGGVSAALGVCLDRIEAGQPLERVLSELPEHAEALRPLLETAIGLRETSQGPAPEVLARRIDAAIDDAPTAEHPSQVPLRPDHPSSTRFGAAWLAGLSAGLGRLGPRVDLRQSLLRLAALLLALGLATAGAVRASADSLPGSPLYPIKRLLETGQLLVLPEMRAEELAQRLADRRLSEAAELVSAGRSPQPALAGLEQLAPWREALPELARLHLDGDGDALVAAEAGLAADDRPEATVATAIARTGPTAALALRPTATPTELRLPPKLPLASATASSVATPPSLAASPKPWPSAIHSPTTSPPPPGDDDDDEEPAPPATSTAIVVPPIVATATEASTRPQPPGAGWNPIEGTVGSIAGPIAGARVAFVDAATGERIGGVDTNAAGYFRYRLAKGKVFAVASADGHATQWFRGAADRKDATPILVSGDGVTIALSFKLKPVLGLQGQP